MRGEGDQQEEEEEEREREGKGNEMWADSIDSQECEEWAEARCESKRKVRKRGKKRSLPAAVTERRENEEKEEEAINVENDLRRVSAPHEVINGYVQVCRQKKREKVN